jgi:hypothetical protein
MMSMSVIVMGVGNTLPKTSNSQPLISWLPLDIYLYLFGQLDRVFFNDRLQRNIYFTSAMYILGEMMLAAVASASTVLIMVLSRRAYSGVPPPIWLKR